MLHESMNLLINIDVPDLARAIAFDTAAFGLSVTRRLRPEVAELDGWPARLYLLQKSPVSLRLAGCGKTLEDCHSGARALPANPKSMNTGS